MTNIRKAFIKQLKHVFPGPMEVIEGYRAKNILLEKTIPISSPSFKVK